MSSKRAQLGACRTFTIATRQTQQNSFACNYNGDSFPANRKIVNIDTATLFTRVLRQCERSNRVAIDDVANMGPKRHPFALQTKMADGKNKERESYRSHPKKVRLQRLQGRGGGWGDAARITQNELRELVGKPGRPLECQARHQGHRLERQARDVFLTQLAPGVGCPNLGSSVLKCIEAVFCN